MSRKNKRNGFAKVPRGLLALAHHRNLSPRSFVVLVALLTYASEENRTPFPSQKTLAAITGLSERTVKRAVKEIQAKLGVVVTPRRISGGFPVNQYDLGPLLDAAWEIGEKTDANEDAENAASYMAEVRQAADDEAAFNVRLGGPTSPPRDRYNRYDLTNIDKAFPGVLDLTWKAQARPTPSGDNRLDLLETLYGLWIHDRVQEDTKIEEVAFRTIEEMCTRWPNQYTPVTQEELGRLWREMQAPAEVAA